MATHHEAPETYTDAEMLAFVRQATVEVSKFGKSYAIPGGRAWTGPDLPELHEKERFYLARIESAQYGRVFNITRIRTR